MTLLAASETAARTTTVRRTEAFIMNSFVIRIVPRERTDDYQVGRAGPRGSTLTRLSNFRNYAIKIKTQYVLGTTQIVSRR